MRYWFKSYGNFAEWVDFPIGGVALGRVCAQPAKHACLVLPLFSISCTSRLEAQLEAQLEAWLEAQLEAQLDAQLEAQLQAQLEAQMEALCCQGSF